MRDEGSKDSEMDIKTWEHLERLARDCPEAGIHFQSTRGSSDTSIYSHIPESKILHRAKDQTPPTRSAGLFSQDPWWKEGVSDV